MDIADYDSNLENYRREQRVYQYYYKLKSNEIYNKHRHKPIQNRINEILKIETDIIIRIAASPICVVNTMGNTVIENCRH